MNNNQEHRYHPWIEAIVVVEFDLDEGQKVSVSVPQLCADREKQISMLSFPDSNCCSENQTLYKYIFRTSHQQFGFVCFKQKKDENNKRGYAQKSFVVVTRLPFLNFFQKITEFMVFKLYALSKPTLQQEISKIMLQTNQWPQPEPLSRLTLPLLDYHLTANTPNYIFNSGTGFVKAENFANYLRREKPLSIEEGVEQEILIQMGRFQEVRLTEVFGGKEEQLWALWEHSILNHALLLMADTPFTASQAVLAAASLTNPIEYAGEIHPYVTVYDSHLSELQQSCDDVLLGGTNPLFFKLFSKCKLRLEQVGAITVSKHLRPVRELFVYSDHEHHKLVNQSALRKYFYKVNCGIVAVIDQYLDQQTNDLKFFNHKDFLKFVRKRQSEDPLQQIIEGRRAILSFWEEFIASTNFLNLLRSRNVVRNLN